MPRLRADDAVQKGLVEHDVCHCGTVAHDKAADPDLNEVVRSLRDEIVRLRAEIERLHRERDERPPHYL